METGNSAFIDNTLNIFIKVRTIKFCTYLYQLLIYFNCLNTAFLIECWHSVFPCTPLSIVIEIETDNAEFHKFHFDEKCLHNWNTTENLLSATVHIEAVEWNAMSNKSIINVHKAVFKIVKNLQIYLRYVHILYNSLLWIN